MTTEWISLPEAAMKLAVSYRAAFDMMCEGKLRARKNTKGRWEVLDRDVSRLLRARERAATPVAQPA